MLPLCFAAFLAFGAVLVLVGANQPSLAAELDLDLAGSGLLASALAAGIGVGVVVAGPLFDRYARRPLFVASLVFAGVALSFAGEGLTLGHWLAILVGTGFGVGLYDTLISAVVVQRYGERSARPMLGVHAAATLGAVLMPLLVAWISARWHWSASFSALAWAHFALAAWAAVVPLPAPSRASSGGAAEPIRARSLWPFAAIAFAYVGVEAGVTVFAPPYAIEGLGLDATRGAFSISAFWLGLLVGRVGILALPTKLDARVLRTAGALSALLIGVVGARFLAAPEILLFATGAALGSVYPLMIALTGQRFPDARGTATGLAAGAGALGGFALPWLSGALGDRWGVAAAFGSLALWCAAIAAAAIAAGRRP